MTEILLDPDPSSTYEADEAYRAAWLAAYGNTVSPTWPTPTPGVIEPYVIDEAVLPDYLKRESIGVFIQEAVGDFALGTVVQEFSFAEASNLWVCDHTFNRLLLDIVTVDLYGESIIGDVRYESVSRVVIEWFYPTTGTARLST